MGRFFFVCLLLSACTTSPVVRNVSLPRASVTPNGEAPGVVVSPVSSPVAPQPSSLPGVIATPAPVASGPSFPLPQPSVLPSSGVLPGFSNGGGGGGGGSVPQPTPTPVFYIQDVLLNNRSIVSSSEKFTSDYEGKQADLIINGNFGIVNTLDFAFTKPNELLHQTFLDGLPLSRVILNDSLLLEVVEANSHRLHVRLDSTYVPDLYLIGVHKLSLEHAGYYADTLIQVGEPLGSSDLLPRIDHVEVLTNEEGQPVRLKLTGKNFMLFPKFSYSTVDGVFAFGHQTQIFTSGVWDTVVYIPDPAAFISQGVEHEVRYATPFGLVVKTFEWEAE